MNTHRRVLLTLALLVAGSVGLSGCTTPGANDGKPCPCAGGSVCCDTGVCAEDQDSCQATSTALFQRSAGEWFGYLENYGGFPSGSDALTISLSVSSEGMPLGQVVFGEKVPPPEPQPSDISWPPALSAGQLVRAIGSVLEGAPYPAHDLRWERNRLRFSIQRFEPWTPFCAQQFPHAVAESSTGYLCGPARIIWEQDDTCHWEGTSEPVDCRRAYMCGGGPGMICECTAAECHAGPSLPVSFDLALRNGAGDGSTTLTRSGNSTTNIRLLKR